MGKFKYSEEEQKTVNVLKYQDDQLNELMKDSSERRNKTGRKIVGDIIAYQIRQSFKPGEITPEEANKIGYETAMRWTKGQHAFIVATHVDKAHIHNHIIYNSTTLSCDRKFRNFWFCGVALQRLSDLVCLENGLSVIEPVKPSQRVKRTEYPDRRSFREDIRDAIDSCLEQNPKDMDELLRLLLEMGYESKRGKYVSVKGKGQKKFLRFRSLGAGYREQDLERIFAGETREKVATAEEETEPKDHGFTSVHNCFLMPTENDEIENKGEVSMEMLSNLGLKNIQVRFIPAKMAYDIYLSGQKMDIALLKL